MAYTVNKTNSSATPNSYTVQDSILNSQTDISFIGKGYAGYGEIVAENFPCSTANVTLNTCLSI